ncbi:MAG: response regulator transcription factor [Methyloprofundus sp.]|nr:response regulator transcription factor [Methyloprofundus sp.]
MNILLVEDDAVLSNGLSLALQQNGYTLITTDSGQYALQLLELEDFDLLILDLGLPDMDGMQILRSIRHKKIALPVLILTARDDVNDRIEGINQGADDYLTKPFDLGELEARIHALIRRCYSGFSDQIHVGQLELNTQNHEITANGQHINLSARELALLEILILQTGKVVCKDRISQRLAASGEALADNAIEVAIHRLRKRIEPYQAEIKTVRGLGYLLEAQS